MDLRFRRLRKKKGSGQTLLLSVIVLLAILLAALIIFEIHNAVRGKVKGQNAADAAALAGANWQMHTLNLIGELNLVKAAEVLISDPVLGIGQEPEAYMKAAAPEKLDTPEKLQAELERVEQEKQALQKVLDLLTEMQTRISFVGPLIGVGAAQQAAKNNGIAANQESGRFLYDYLFEREDIRALYQDGHLTPQNINGYVWYTPYISMIREILDAEDKDRVYGIAAVPHVHFLGTPTAESDLPGLSQYLAVRSFYDAVIGENWCALIGFLDASAKTDMSGAWWGRFRISSEMSFLRQSEILPVYVDYFTGSAPYTGAERYGAVSGRLEKRNSRPLAVSYDPSNPYPYAASSGSGVRYTGTFDERGLPVVNEKDSDMRLSLPEITWAVFGEQWTAYDSVKKNQWETYLNRPFKPGTAYSGPVSCFEISQTGKTYWGFSATASALKDAGSPGAGTDSLGGRISDNARSAAETGGRMRNFTVPIAASASAKPIGSIQTDQGPLPPFGAGGLVLPVFTNAALIPVSLDPAGGLSAVDVAWAYFVSEFLPILGQSDSLARAKQEAKEQFPKHAHYFSYFCSALEKLNDPAWRQRGLEWLNTPISYYTDTNGETRVRQRNRDTCNYWPGGGGEPRHGPSILH